MARYINADILSQEIDKLQSELQSNNDAIWKINKPIYKGLCLARGIIDDIPSAEVEKLHGDKDKKLVLALMSCSPPAKLYALSVSANCPVPD